MFKKIMSGLALISLLNGLFANDWELFGVLVVGTALARKFAPMF